MPHVAAIESKVAPIASDVPLVPANVAIVAPQFPSVPGDVSLFFRRASKVMAAEVLTKFAVIERQVAAVSVAVHKIVSHVAPVTAYIAPVPVDVPHILPQVMTRCEWRWPDLC